MSNPLLDNEPGTRIEREEVRCRAVGLWRVECECWVRGVELWESTTYAEDEYVKRRYWLPYAERCQ